MVEPLCHLTTLRFQCALLGKGAFFSRLIVIASSEPINRLARQCLLNFGNPPTKNSHHWRAFTVINCAFIKVASPHTSARACHTFLHIASYHASLLPTTTAPVSAVPTRLSMPCNNILCGPDPPTLVPNIKWRPEATARKTAIGRGRKQPGAGV